MGAPVLAALVAAGYLAQVPVGARPTVEVESLIGAVVIEAGGAGLVSLRAEVEGDDFAATATLVAGVLRVRSGCAQDRCGRGSVKLFLRVPPESAVRVFGVASAVTVSGVRGPLLVETIAGDVHVRGAGPMVQAFAEAGRVRVEPGGVPVWRMARRWLLRALTGLRRPAPRASCRESAARDLL